MYSGSRRGRLACSPLAFTFEAGALGPADLQGHIASKQLRYNHSGARLARIRLAHAFRIPLCHVHQHDPSEALKFGPDFAPDFCVDVATGDELVRRVETAEWPMSQMSEKKRTMNDNGFELPSREPSAAKCVLQACEQPQQTSRVSFTPRSRKPRFSRPSHHSDCNFH